MMKTRYLLSVLSLLTVLLSSLAVPREAAAFANDFKNATPVPDPSQNYFSVYYDPPAQNNTGYGYEPGETSHHPLLRTGPFRSAWWKIQFSWSGYLTLNTQGSGIDTVMSVYSGNKLKTLTRIVSNDDLDRPSELYYSQVSFFVQKGKTYYVAVDGYNSGASGTMKLKIAHCVPMRQQTYVGLVNVVTDGLPTPETSGLLKVTTTATGAVTGTFSIGKKQAAFRSRVGMDRKIVANIAMPKLADGSYQPDALLDLTLPDSTVILGAINATGVIRCYSVTSGVMTEAALNLHPEDVTAVAARYNLSSQTSAFGINLPRTVASVVVTAKNRVSMAGRALDGTPFTMSGRLLLQSLAVSGKFCGRRVLHGGSGLLTYDVFFSDSGVGNVSGSCQFYRRSNFASALYPQGYDEQVNVMGRKHVPPTAGQPVSDDLATPGNLIVVNTSYGTIVRGRSVTNRHRIAFGNPNTERMRYKLNPRTGVLSGSMNLPTPDGVTKRGSFFSVLLNEVTGGYDVFAGQIKEGDGRKFTYFYFGPV